MSDDVFREAVGDVYITALICCGMLGIFYLTGGM